MDNVISDAKICGEFLQIERNFPAFHVGMAKHRPGIETAHQRLFLAGDWVDTPYPSALMEGACMSGLIAANRICAAEGLATQAVLGVPARGLFAPSRKKPQVHQQPA